MTIARFKSNLSQPTPCMVEGPYDVDGNWPLAGFSLGDHASGDAGSEFIFVLYAVVNNITLNQGDFFTFDNTFYAMPTFADGRQGIGSNLGTLHLGGRFGQDHKDDGPHWRFTFTTGVWGIWLQIAGVSLGRFDNLYQSNTSQYGVTFTPISGGLSVTDPPGKYSGISAQRQYYAMSGTSNVGSPYVYDYNRNDPPPIGLYADLFSPFVSFDTGPGYVLAVDNEKITWSEPALTYNPDLTTFITNNSYGAGNFTQGSNLITKVKNIRGLYPGQVVAQGGLPANTYIVNIIESNPWTIVLSANFNQVSVRNAFTVSGYTEVSLNYPICIAT